MLCAQTLQDPSLVPAALDILEMGHHHAQTLTSVQMDLIVVVEMLTAQTLQDPSLVPAELDILEMGFHAQTLTSVLQELIIVM